MKTVAIHSQKTKRPIIKFNVSSVVTRPEKMNTKYIMEEDVTSINYEIKQVGKKKFMIILIYLTTPNKKRSYVKITHPYTQEMFNIYRRLLNIERQNEQLNEL